MEMEATARIGEYSRRPAAKKQTQALCLAVVQDKSSSTFVLDYFDREEIP